MTAVAVRKKGCVVCDTSPDAFQAVNEAIWDGLEPLEGNRVRGYRATGQAALATYSVKVDVRLLTRHAVHVERAHREVGGTGPAPATSREIPVYATDFESVTSRMASIGMRAAAVLEEKMEFGELEDKALVATAAMGLKAATSRETANRAERTPQVNLLAIFGVAGGYLSGNVGESRTIEGEFTELDLKAQVQAQREHLKELQG